MYFLLFGTIKIELWHHLRDWKVRKEQSITFRNRKTGAVSLIIYLSTIQRLVTLRRVNISLMSATYLIYIWYQWKLIFCVVVLLILIRLLKNQNMACKHIIIQYFNRIYNTAGSNMNAYNIWYVHTWAWFFTFTLSTRRLGKTFHVM